MVVLLRTLTLKSKIGFGIFKNCTVEEIIKSGRHKELINIYFRLANVTFVEEILCKLHISERVQKPGKNVELAPIYCAKFTEITKKNPIRIEKVRSVDSALEIYHKKNTKYNNVDFSPHMLAWYNQGHKLKFV